MTGILDKLKSGGAQQAPPAQAAPSPAKPDAAALVRQLSSQGMAEPAIITELKNKGYSYVEIDKAISEALKSSVDTSGVTPLGAPAVAGGEAQPLVEAPEAPAQMVESGVGVQTNIEAVIERVVEERLEDFKASAENLAKELSAVKEEVENLDQSLKTQEDQLGAKAAGLEDRVDALAGRVDELEPKLAAIEKAFKDIVPTLVDTVRSATEKVKADKAAKKEASAAPEETGKAEEEPEKE